MKTPERSRHRLSRNLLLLGSALIGFHAEVKALEPEDVLYFRAGPLALKPQLALSEMYNDNIFYLPKDEVQDFVTVLSPGLKLQLGRLEHNYFLLGYTLDELIYADNSNLDAAQHTIDIKDRLEGERLSLTGSDHIQFASNPLGGVERILVARNIDRTSYNDLYTLSYNISEKTVAYLRGTYDALDYQDGIPLYDVDTLTGTAGFGYRVLPKTTVFGEVYYGETSTHGNFPTLPKNPDVSFVGGYVGARGNFTEKLSGSVKVGYETREFSDGTSAPSDPVVDLSLVQRFSEKTALSLNYSRQNNVSAQFTRESYTADIVSLQISQLFGSGGKWQATAGGYYYRYEYDLDGRSAGSYDYARGSLSLAYKIQLWLTATLGYDFERLTGNQQGNVDYTVNRVTLRLAIGY